MAFLFTFSFYTLHFKFTFRYLFSLSLSLSLSVAIVTLKYRKVCGERKNTGQRVNNLQNLVAVQLKKPSIHYTLPSSRLVRQKSVNEIRSSEKTVITIAAVIVARRVTTSYFKLDSSLFLFFLTNHKQALALTCHLSGSHSKGGNEKKLCWSSQAVLPVFMDTSEFHCANTHFIKHLLLTHLPSQLHRPSSPITLLLLLFLISLFSSLLRFFLLSPSSSPSST